MQIANRSVVSYQPCTIGMNKYFIAWNKLDIYILIIQIGVIDRFSMFEGMTVRLKCGCVFNYESFVLLFSYFWRILLFMSSNYHNFQLKSNLFHKKCFLSTKFLNISNSVFSVFSRMGCTVSMNFKMKITSKSMFFLSFPCRTVKNADHIQPS